MKQTSERLDAGHAKGTALYEIHMAAYRWAANYAAGARILDYGCGTGYGAEFLSETAEHVTGFDIDADAVAYARDRFSRDNLGFTTEPPAEGAYDLAVSFQVIEHVDPNAYFSSIRRALKPGGRLLLTTPNRSVRLYSWQQPWNRWHLTEYDRDGLMSLLREHFSTVESWFYACSPDIRESELTRYRRMQHLLMPATLIPWYPLRFRVLALTARLFAPHGQRTADVGGTAEIVPDAPEGVCLAAMAVR